MAKAKQTKLSQALKVEIDKIVNDRIKPQAVTKSDLDEVKNFLKEISEGLKSALESIILLQQPNEITINKRISRGYISDKEGDKIEVNIVGEGEKNDESIMIIGECKSQLSKNDVDDFVVYASISPVSSLI
ncbi:MAG: hypothetical protein N2252_01830 [Candidatus Kryptonium sp.]|nr:hypothetical protein [Candidatus Kryptonium sp.]MCX7761559.1 hypothetical protein [Candidatus Kryptonium sp.]